MKYPSFCIVVAIILTALGICRPAAAESARPGPGTARASAGAVPDWTSFVSVVMQTNPGLASCLMTCLPEVDLDHGRLKLAFEPENDFMMRQVEVGAESLASHVTRTFGKPLALELMLVETGEGPSQDQQDAVRQEIAPTDRETLARQRTEDPTLDKLVDLVRGEPLPDTELERWQVGPEPPAPPPDDTED